MDGPPKASESSRAPYITVVAFFGVALVLRIFPSNAWASGLTHNYLSLHILLEFIGILVSFSIANVGWATFKNTRDLPILVLSFACLTVGALDLGHTLTFSGMPEFFGPNEPNRTIGFWLASRIVGSCAFLYVSMFTIRSEQTRSLRWWLLAGSSLILVSSYYVILFRSDVLPVFFVPGSGLTSIKIALEWGCVLLSAVASVLLFRRGAFSENVNMRWMGAACAVYAICGYFFTIYSNFNDLYVFTGHCFKALSAIVLYRAIFAESVAKPFENLKTLVAAAESANLAKSRFLANVSHEFRTPLGVIAGFSEMLVGSSQLKGDQLRWIETVHRNSRQLAHLIDDLLDIAKAESQKIELVISEFDLTAELKELVESFRPLAEAKGVQLKFSDVDCQDRQICSDPVRVRQIVTNLLSNALKFTSAGQVSVQLAQDKRGAFLISVRDTGIGIAQSDIALLFQPFAQVGDASKRTFGGTGLGLSLSKNLAELMGGRLILKNTAPNKGSEFHLSLIDHSDAAALNKKSASALKHRQPNFDGKKILIAEDSTDNQELLKAYLKPTNAHIDFAINGKVALDCFAAQIYDLIILDIQMPVMDGFETAMNLRKAGWRSHLLALTAHALGPERERALKCGFDEYLVKPIKKGDLLTALEQRIG